MRLPCVPSCALRELRTPLAFARINQRHSLHRRPYSVAVIGAGITGLTAAYRLSQDPGCSKVTLYEKSPRVGGWLQSETVAVDGGDVVFEYGPRTLRASVPSCLPLLDMIIELGLHDQLVLTKKSSPASLNRYIYYPDHLVRVPTPNIRDGLFSNISNLLRTLLREPAFETFLLSLVNEPWKEISELPDESIEDFVSRRMSPQVANNLVSGVYHGILGGDIRRLSAQTLLGDFRLMEHKDARVLGTLLQEAQEGIKRVAVDDPLAMHSTVSEKPGHYWKCLSALIQDTSAFTLRHGVGQLTDALVTELNKSGKVDVLTGTDVHSIIQNPKTSDLTIGFGNNETRTHNRIIATHPATALAKQLANVPRNGKVPHSTISNLQERHYAVSLRVINLYYPNPDLVPVRGFGYLIPQSVPYEQNPERALGVIFGSESSVGQDTAPGTKLTVMMGGHWWDDWGVSDIPDHDTAVEMSRSLLKRHLGITDVPTVARSRLQWNAIPQPTIGHLSLMSKLSQSIRHEFDSRITLAGAWYGTNGPGVVDCVRQAYLASSYGVGVRKMDYGPLLEKFSNMNWDLEGGIPCSPVRTARWYKSDFDFDEF